MQHVATGYKGFSPPMALSNFQEQPLSRFQEPQLGEDFPPHLPPMHDVSPSCSLVPCSRLGNEVWDLQRVGTPLSVPVPAVSGICVLGVLQLVVARLWLRCWLPLSTPCMGGLLASSVGLKKAKYWEGGLLSLNPA